MDENIEIDIVNIDQEFWNDFILEAFEHIEEIESNVLELEKDTENMDIIHTMFRAFHTIKGLSGFVEHTVIQEIAHKTETLMDFCRKGEMKVDKNIVNAILKSSDFIKQLCEDITSCKDKAYILQIKKHIDFLEELAENHEKANNLAVSEKKPEEIPLVEEEVIVKPNIEDLANIDFGFDEEPEKEPPLEEKTEILDEIKIEEEKMEKKQKKAKQETKPKTSKKQKEEEVVLVEEIKEIKETPIESLKEEVVFVEEVKQEPVKVEIKQPVQPEPVVESEPAVAVQSEAEQPKKLLASDDYMKVSNAKIDHLVNMIGELIINQSLIEQYLSSSYTHDNKLITSMAGLSRITRELQDLSMFFRMVSLKPTFQKLTRIARDTIQELGKDVDFIVTGETTEIDRVVTDKLLDPLVHLIKNAISHGVEEDVKDRTAIKKSAKAKVELTAYNKRGKIYIEVKDDGRGIDTEIVYQKALEKGLIDSNKTYSEEEIKEFILLPGFSTAKQVDNISGRGVGMDVVKTQIQKIGGKVDIKSELGKGSTFTLEVPVNHAIMNGTVIEISGQQFIIPTMNVREILQPKDEQWIFTQNKRTMLRVRESIVPLLPLKLFSKDFLFEDNIALVILLELDQELRALPIANVLNRQEVVVKPVGEEFANLKYISGMSILGNGKVSLILDIDYLFTMEVKE